MLGCLVGNYFTAIQLVLIYLVIRPPCNMQCNKQHCFLIALEQALRGSLAAGLEKEGASLQLRLHLHFPCGSQSTELSICIHAQSEWELNPSKISREKRSWRWKTSFLNMTGAKISTKGIWGMPVDSNIHQSAYRDRWQFKTTTLLRTGMFVWSRYADWWIWIDAHTSNAFGWDFCTGHVEKAGLATSGSLFSRNFGRIELSFGWGMDTYLVDREPVFSR